MACKYDPDDLELTLEEDWWIGQEPDQNHEKFGAVAPDETSPF